MVLAATTSKYAIGKERDGFKSEVVSLMQYEI
jgi:hypothetical protein